MSRDYVASNVAQALIPQSIQFLRVKIVALDNSGHSSEELVAFLTVYILFWATTEHILILGQVLQTADHCGGLSCRFFYC